MFVGLNRESASFNVLGDQPAVRESFVAGPVALSAGSRLSLGPFSLDLAAVLSKGGRDPVVVRPWVGFSIDTRPR